MLLCAEQSVLRSGTMSRQSFYDLVVVQGATTTGTGTAFPITDYENKWVQIGGTFVGTVTIEITVDGSNWETVASTTTKAIIQVLPMGLLLRINRTVSTSGQPSAKLTAVLVRGDG